MGTRADFYVGRGENAEWIGSIAWDGYPEGIDKAVFKSKTEAEYRGAVAEFLKDRDDRTFPADGWPWPWETSATTDYAYALDGGKVHASCFGSNWFNPRGRVDDEGNRKVSGVAAEFPDMSKIKQRPKFGKHSGVILISG